jgi:hypothetical protein
MWIDKMEFLKPWICLICAATLLLCSDIAGAQESQRDLFGRTPPSRRADRNESDLTRLRADVIEKMKEARASAQKLHEIHELEQKELSNAYGKQRELYRDGLIARGDVIQAEHALAKAILRVDQDRRWLAETDIVIIEASMRDELLRLPGLGVGGYSESATLLRFNGAAPWSMADAPRIERFFLQTFGRALPVTALGQTPTHERLKFDHRDAMDVALHPDSKEGQSLLNYLRQVGIPFIAFKSAVPGAATGAHIHIGKASPRT